MKFLKHHKPLHICNGQISYIFLRTSTSQLSLFQKVCNPTRSLESNNIVSLVCEIVTGLQFNRKQNGRHILVVFFFIGHHFTFYHINFKMMECFVRFLHHCSTDTSITLFCTCHPFPFSPNKHASHSVRPANILHTANLHTR